MRSPLLVLVAVMGCAGEDGASPVAYRLYVYGNEPAERPTVATPPTVYIDGEARTELELQYASPEEAMADAHLVELRFGDTVARSMPVNIQANGGCFERQGSFATSYGQTFCALDSGDLRFSHDSGVIPFSGGSVGHCTGDGFCLPNCMADSCGSQRCASRVTSTNPFASHLDCVPIGPRLAGETCTLIASASGAYDDCGTGLACLGGTCAAARVGCSGDYIPGHAPELRRCP